MPKKKKWKLVGLEKALQGLPPHERAGVAAELEEMFRDFDPENAAGEPVVRVEPGTRVCPRCGGTLVGMHSVLRRKRGQAGWRALRTIALLFTVLGANSACGHGCDDIAKVGLRMRIRDAATGRDLCDASVTTDTRNGRETLGVGIQGESCEYSGLVGQAGAFTLHIARAGYVDRDIVVRIPEDDCNHPVTQFRDVALDPG